MGKKTSAVLYARAVTLEAAIADGLKNCLAQPELEAPFSCVDRYLGSAQVQLKAHLAQGAASFSSIALWYEGADAMSQQRAQVEQGIDEAQVFYHCMSPETLRALKMSAALCGQEITYGEAQAEQCADMLRDAQAIEKTCEPLTETFHASVNRLSQLVKTYQNCDAVAEAPNSVIPEQVIRKEFQELTDTLCFFAPTIGEARLNEWLLEQGLEVSDAQGLGFLILGGASGFSGKVPYGASRITSVHNCGDYLAACEFPYAQEDSAVSPEVAAN